MKKTGAILIILYLLVILSACHINSASVSTPTKPFLSTPTPIVIPETNYSLNNAIQTLAQRLDLDPAQISVIAVEAIDWPDACLGIHLPERMCAMVVTPGYKIILEAQGKQYEFHTDKTGATIVLASAPKPGIGEISLVWESAAQPCQTIEVGIYGAAVGDCGGALIQTVFASAERVTELKAFVKTYQTFTSDTLAGKITLTGQGNRTASASEQRSIAEWANIVYMEAISGRSGAAWGNAFAWHREGGIAGFCDDLVVYRSGMATASSCRTSSSTVFSDVRLNSAQLDQLYQYLDTYKPGEIKREDNPGGADNMTITMTFAGTGSQTLTDAIKQELMAFASTLYLSINK